MTSANNYPTSVVRVWLYCSLIALLVTNGFYALRLATFPTVVWRTISSDDQVLEASSEYLEELFDRGTYHFDTEITSPSIPYHYYDIHVDDRLIDLTVNNKFVRLRNASPRFGNSAAMLPLGPLMTFEKNTLSANVWNEVGPTSFNVLPSRLDAMSILLFVGVVLAGLAVTLWICHRARLSYAWMGVCLIPLGVTVLRLMYALSTPWWVRQYDMAGHLEYIRFVGLEWAIPKFDQGWQTYQPPLYYFLSAVWLKVVGTILQTSETYSHELLLGFSLLLNTLSAVAAAGVGLLLGSSPASISAITLFSLIATILPGDIFLSARINNDVLAQLLAVLIIVALMRWWARPEMRRWLVLSLFICAALLSKSNLIILIAAAGACLLFQPKISWRNKLAQGAATLLLVTLLCGWYVQRRLNDGQSHLIGNIEDNSEGLFSEDSFDSFVVFNPLKVLSLIYNDAWDDEFRRRFLWEYTFRSAFFAEFTFPDSWAWITSGLLLVSMQLFCVSIWGMYKDLRNISQVSIPMWVLLLITLAFKVLVRATYSNGGLADFRYTPFLAIPLAYFLMVGYQALKPSLRAITFYLACALGVLTTTFILYIFLATGSKLV